MNWVLNLFSTDFFSEEQDSSKLAAETTASPYPSPVPFTGGTILKSKDDPYLNADSAEQLRTESPAGRRYRQICHMLCQKGQSQDSKVVNTDSCIENPLSDLES